MNNIDTSFNASVRTLHIGCFSIEMYKIIHYQYQHYSQLRIMSTKVVQGIVRNVLSACTCYEPFQENTIFSYLQTLLHINKTQNLE